MLVLAQAVVEEALPGTEPGERERRALDARQPARLRRQCGRREDGVLGGDAVAIERGEREDQVALRDFAHVRRDPGDDA